MDCFLQWIVNNYLKGQSYEHFFKILLENDDINDCKIINVCKIINLIDQTLGSRPKCMSPVYLL